jgi:hypothetical protein
LAPRLHSIVVQKGAESTTVPVASFLSLPLNERLALILEQRITFYDEDRNIVALKDALRLLQEIASNGGSAAPAPTVPPLVEAAGEVSVISLQRFLALPISQRVTMLLGPPVRILDENGVEIPPKEALARGRSAP